MQSAVQLLLDMTAGSSRGSSLAGADSLPGSLPGSSENSPAVLRRGDGESSMGMSGVDAALATSAEGHHHHQQSSSARASERQRLLASAVGERLQPRPAAAMRRRRRPQHKSPGKGRGRARRPCARPALTSCMRPSDLRSRPAGRGRRRHCTEGAQVARATGCADGE